MNRIYQIYGVGGFIKKVVRKVKVEYIWVDLRNKGVPRHPFHVVASSP